MSTNHVHFTCKYIDLVIKQIQECRSAISQGMDSNDPAAYLDDAFNSLYRLEDQMEDIRSDNMQLRDNWDDAEKRINELEDELKSIDI